MGFQTGDGPYPKENRGVKYHEVHIRRLLHKWGFKSKVPLKRFIGTASHQEKKRVLKKDKRNPDQS